MNAPACCGRLSDGRNSDRLDVLRKIDQYALTEVFTANQVCKAQTRSEDTAPQSALASRPESEVCTICGGSQMSGANPYPTVRCASWSAADL